MTSYQRLTGIRFASGTSPFAPLVKRMHTPTLVVPTLVLGVVSPQVFQQKLSDPCGKKIGTVNLNPVRRNKTTDMLPGSLMAYATSTIPLSSYATTFVKEPGKTQQRDGLFAVWPLPMSPLVITISRCIHGEPRGRRSHYVHASTSF